jgi:dCTP deaminase
MILTGKEIAACVGKSEIIIDPFDQRNCNPNSYNFHLGEKLLTYGQPTHSRVDAINAVYIVEAGCGLNWCLDSRRDNPTRELTIPLEGVVLQPGVLYLGHTVERIGSSRYAPMMAARSSVGRLGLFIYVNSGLGDVGFVGQWTLELTVIHPLRVYPGDAVGQMIFFETRGEQTQYSGRYVDAAGPQASRMHQPAASDTNK